MRAQSGQHADLFSRRRTAGMALAGNTAAARACQPMADAQPIAVDALVGDPLPRIG